MKSKYNVAQILNVFADHILIVLINAEKGVLKPPTMILELFTSVFNSVTFCIMYFVKHINIFFLRFIYLFIYFLAVLGLRFCARALSSCGERGPLFIAVHGPLTVTASLVTDYKLQTRRLSSCGSRA